MRLVREHERARITGVPRSTWYLRMNEGSAPKPVPLGEHSVAWVESELVEWVARQIRRRDDETLPNSSWKATLQRC
ncbi:MAG: AlpA family phage regulatory protein [Proteobacteria bacterium]|nr:AlpA family phage regulatory protein [Pseudomonadota bacterium]